MSEEKLLNLLNSKTKQNQVRTWLKEGKKNFIERLLKDESEEARMEFQRLKSSNCFKQYFNMDVQRKIAMMERDEQWDQLRNFVRAQGNRDAIDEHSKWEQRNGISVPSPPVTNTATGPRHEGIYGSTSAISTADTENNRNNLSYDHRGQFSSSSHLSGNKYPNMRASESVTHDTNSFLPRPPVHAAQPSPYPTTSQHRTTTIKNSNSAYKKTENYEQWKAGTNFVRAQGNDTTTSEHSKREQRNGIAAASSSVSKPVVPKPRDIENHINNASSFTHLPSKRNSNIQLNQKLPKQTDRKWMFLIPANCCGLVIGKGGQHVKRYNQQKYVELSSQMDPKSLRVEGLDTSFGNVYDVCMDIWKRIVATYKGIVKEFISPSFSVRIDRMNPNQFQQLLFMEDYNVLFRKIGSSWEICAFSREELQMAKMMLESSHPFRQDAPFYSTSSVDALTPAISSISLNEKKPELNQVEKGKRKAKPVYNKKAFEKPPTKVVIDNNDSISHRLKKETNILLLGQSGVGKSTFLNSFANYIEFGQDFNKAEAGLRVMIKSSYVFSYDEAGQEIYTDPLEVLLQPDGVDDGNEVLGDGQSATQEARCYTFQYTNHGEEKTIKVIDTPGLLDTQGIEKDQENMAQILKCVKRFPTIQAIVFLLKPDEARATAPLLYNLSELLKRIHKNAAENILFCFPRSDWKTQLDATKTLRPFFKKISDTCKVNLEMKMSGIDGYQNVFRFDNYGFLYCGAKKFAGFKDKGKEREMAMERWTNSVKDIEKMLHTIANLRDYPIQRTLEINDTRNWLKALAEPMADLSRQVLNSENSLRAKQDKIKQLALDQKAIENHATHEEHQFVRVPLDNWRVCCYEQNCCISYNQSDQIPDVCHDNCECYEGEEECKIFKNGICSKCNCPWDAHRRMKWKLERSIIVVTSEAGVLAANTNATERQKANKVINDLEQHIKKNKESMERMQKNAAIFAAFLQQNSLITEDDSFGMYLNQCMELAKASGDQNQCEKLNKFKDKYEQEKNMLKLAEETGEKVTFEKVRETLEDMEKDPIISESIKKYKQILGINDDEAVAEEKCQTLRTLFGRNNTR